MKKFKGFTLTELMIALAIISVLSALMLPMLSDNSPNRNKMMMKKAYYTISDIVNDLLSDMSLYPDVDGTYVGFDNLTNVCGEEMCENSAKFPILFTKRLNIDSDIDFNGDKSRANFTTNDGMIWTVSSKKTSSPPEEVEDVEGGEFQVLQTITVDINGDKKPNCMQGDDSCKGKESGFDRFKVYVTQSGNIVPAKGQKWFVDAIGIGSSLNGD